MRLLLGVGALLTLVYLLLIYFTIAFSTPWTAAKDRSKLYKDLGPILYDVNRIISTAEVLLQQGDAGLITPSTCCHVEHGDGLCKQYTAAELFRRWRINDRGFSLSNITVRDLQKRGTKLYYVTYAHNCCQHAIARATDRARAFGFDDVRALNETALSKEFKHRHADILRQHRGAGYWLWKPYIILKTLIKDMQWKDYICYVDAGSELIRDPGPLIAFAQHQPYGVWVPHTPGGHLEVQYNKRDTLAGMDMDYNCVLNTIQAQANHICLPKSVYTIQLVTEWLYSALVPQYVNDDPSARTEHTQFVGHRHDQAIWSLLVKKWGIPFWRDATQWGETEMDKEGYSREGSGPYPQIFLHHRNNS